MSGTLPPELRGLAEGEADGVLVARLRAGDQDAFMELVDAWGPSMVRVARRFTPSTAVAEEVVQETWVAVLRGLDRFEGRSSLKTWVFRILMNRGKTRGERERRTIPFSALARDEAGGDFRAVEPERFRPTTDGNWPHHWANPLPRWDTLPEAAVTSAETVAAASAAIDRLPPAQRAVILLRDVEGWSGPEVSSAMGISESHERVLLHRARTKLRKALQEHLVS